MMGPSPLDEKAAVNATGDIFHVVVHDVTPQLIEPLTTILDQLAPLVQGAVAAAVVPRWHGQPWDGAARAVAGLIRARCGEVLLHGYTHHRDRHRGAVSLLTGGADELAGLPAAAVAERLRRGQDLMRDLFGAPPAGFVPPAWMSGPLTPGLLTACWLQYSVGSLRGPPLKNPFPPRITSGARAFQTCHKLPRYFPKIYTIPK